MDDGSSLVDVGVGLAVGCPILVDERCLQGQVESNLDLRTLIQGQLDLRALMDRSW